jgi:hypothetical protein
MLTSSSYGQSTQEKTKIVSIDGQKVAVVPYGSFNAILTRLVICDSISSDNGYNVALIENMQQTLSISTIVIAQQDSIIGNFEKIVKADSTISELDKSEILILRHDLKKEQRKVKIVGGAGIILIVLCLLL